MRCAALFALLISSQAAAQEWEVLEDSTFGYSLPIPPGYELSLRPDTGNSRLFHNPQGDILAVWGSQLAERSFADQVEARRVQDENAGWDITYERVTNEWASYSGVQDDQIRYVRAIRLCCGNAAFFMIDYTRSQKQHYDPLVTRMVRQMRPASGC